MFNQRESENMATNQTPPQFIPLELEHRPTVVTAAAAFYLLLAPQTMRMYACKETGPLLPIRIGNRLHWKTEDIRRLLSGGCQVIKRTTNNHPDGFIPAFNNALLSATANDETNISLPIGPLGLVDLTEKVIAIANDPGNPEEEAGTGIEIDRLNAILAAKTAGKRVQAIQPNVLDLPRPPNSRRAAGDFSVPLVNVLERVSGLSK